MSTLEEAIQNIRMGNRDEGREILEALLDEDENNEDIWLWMSMVVDADEDREICLENVLALDPSNEVAQKGLEALNSGIFNANDLLQELLDEETLEEDEPEPATFIDDFVFSDDDDLDDDDLPLPGEAKKAKKKGGGLNIRYVILGVLALVLVLVLGALAVTSLFLLGDDNGGDEAATPSEQQAPAEGGEPEATATPTETPTPAPTDTPTMTPTSSLQLPTAAPTNTPSPTATRVVSPTPIK